MTRTDALEIIMTLQKINKATLARDIGVSMPTLYRYWRTGKYTCDVVQKISERLGIQNPLVIFFANEVAQHDTSALDVAYAAMRKEA